MPLNGQNFENALILNWVLAFLSGYASARQSPDVAGDVTTAAVAGWLDNYCAANPLDGIPVAATTLRNELLQRRGVKY